MEIQKFFLCLLLFPLLAESEPGSHGGLQGFNAEKLFAFGDSYADTGNTPNTTFAFSWYFPFGITFPGKPTGRYSDGILLTDFLAKYLGLKSPVPYSSRKNATKRLLEYGMNFAYGGSGLFGALNMTTQIDELQSLVVGDGALYTKRELQRSLAFVTVAGNDYFAKNASEDLGVFTTRMINQLSLNLKRIHELGVKKVAVANMPPLGCYPRITAANFFQRCNDTDNAAAALHNQLLQQAVAELNRQSKQSSPFLILDLYTSFISIIKGSGEFETPLTACCTGTTGQSYCSMVDEKGNKMYTLCSDPEAAFFWDAVHPTQAGWRAVFKSIKSTLNH